MQYVERGLSKGFQLVFLTCAFNNDRLNINTVDSENPTTFSASSEKQTHGKAKVFICIEAFKTSP